MTMMKSWNERIHSPKAEHLPKGYNEPYEVRTTVQSVELGRVVKNFANKVYVPSEHFKDLKVEDLYLENILAAGAVDMLNPVQLTPSALEVADNLGNVADGIMDVIDAVENNNDNNTDE